MRREADGGIIYYGAGRGGSGERPGESEWRLREKERGGLFQKVKKLCGFFEYFYKLRV